MEINSETTQQQYTNKLNNMEAQTVKKEEVNVLIEKNDNSEACCAKMLIIFMFTAIFSPFGICDIYFASTDKTCVNQSQESHKLNINLHSYLLASGIINLIIIGIADFSILIFDFNLYQPDKTSEFYMFLKFFTWLNKIFGISWLILGCVLFWGYTDISLCSQNVHDYLFARFILFLVSLLQNLKNDEK